MGEYELVRCINPKWCVVFRPSSGTYLDLWLRGDCFVDLVERVTPVSPVKCQVELGDYKNGVFRDSVLVVEDLKRHAKPVDRYERPSYYKKPKN